jgi:uncharacterized protein (TIGR00255 family)
MTGYGRTTGETALGRVTVEVRSLNHRYLDISVRAPKNLLYLDPEIRLLVRECVSRGKVEVSIALEDRPPELAVDIGRAMEVTKTLRKVAESIGDNVRLEHILAVGEVVIPGEVEMNPESGEAVLTFVADALDNMVEHRIREGRSLAVDLSTRVEELNSLAAGMEELAPRMPDRARQQIQQFLSGVNLTDRLEPQRLELEVALISQKSDITEEITRLKTHMSSFSRTISVGGVAGRRMDFLIQEIQREVNTIGSKSMLPEISQLVVDFKTGLEKVREQVQNIE